MTIAFDEIDTSVKNKISLHIEDWSNVTSGMSGVSNWGGVRTKLNLIATSLGVPLIGANDTAPDLITNLNSILAVAYSPIAAIENWTLDSVDPERSDLITMGTGVASITSTKLGLIINQTTTTAQPALLPTGFNGHPCLEFDGVDDFIDNTGTILWPIGSSGVRIVICVNQKHIAPDVTGPSYFISWGGNNNSNTYGIRKITAGGFNRLVFNVGEGASPTNVTGAITDFSGSHIVDGLSTGTTVSLIANGIPDGSASITPGITTGKTRFGASNQPTPGGFVKGSIGKVFILDPTVPQALIDDLTTYLKTYYGIA